MKKLVNMQSELKAPKNQTNNFGKYKYRSCEDILEALKPILKKHECSLIIKDSIELVGDRFYVKATCILRDDKETIETTAYAREEAVKKGMDGSQITGSSSSYARKYALNGMFLIDDTKDSDSDNPKDNNNDADLVELLNKVSKTIDLDNLQNLWINNSKYHKNNEFKSAVNNKKSQLKN